MSYHTHGGDVYRNKNVIDFSANCNPFGTPKSVKEAAVQAMEEVFHYPDTDCQELREAIGVYEEVRPEWIICVQNQNRQCCLHRLLQNTNRH